MSYQARKLSMTSWRASSLGAVTRRHDDDAPACDDLPAAAPSAEAIGQLARLERASSPFADPVPARTHAAHPGSTPSSWAILTAAS
jgi:hypothetical protein